MFPLQKKILRAIFFLTNLVFILWFAFVLVELFATTLKSSLPFLPRPVAVSGQFLLVLLALVGGYRLLKLPMVRGVLGRWYIPAGIFLLAVLSRLVWLRLYGSMNLDSDYALYMRLGAALAGSGQVPADTRWYVTFAPYVLGYSTFLAALLAIFGKTLAVVQAANILLSGYVAVILFYLGKKIGGRAEMGVMAAALWIGMPAAAGLASLPATELPFIALLLTAAFVCLHLNEPRARGARAALFLLAALLVILMNEIRPLGLLALAALVVYMAITSRSAGIARLKAGPNAALWKAGGVAMILLLFFAASARSGGM